MIGWDQWRSLLAVAQYGSFAQAAQGLGVNATTIGRRIKALEQSLGYELFSRADGRLFPTRRCEALLDYVEAADDALRGAAQHSAPAGAGDAWREMRMTAPPFLINNLFAPALPRLTKTRNLRVELIATSSNAVLTRREADIAIRIEDRPQDFRLDYERIDAVDLPPLTYAVFAARDSDRATLPWAGLIERHPSTTGTKVMNRRTGGKALRYRAQHFDAVARIVQSGTAQALLPHVVARAYPDLVPVTGVELEQPLWMLFLRQDHGVPHLRASRDWIASTAAEGLA
ncbi:MAG: LysR family transcriptional regulator [Albidovulum sp.]|uniref:LysR family transcriptional regulator n=1 Tax=Albidovulum sp. TaxID=1872424 RepID=UPI003CAFFB7E